MVLGPYERDSHHLEKAHVSIIDPQPHHKPPGSQLVSDAEDDDRVDWYRCWHFLLQLLIWASIDLDRAVSKDWEVVGLDHICQLPEVLFDLTSDLHAPILDGPVHLRDGGVVIM